MMNATFSVIFKHRGIHVQPILEQTTKEEPFKAFALRLLVDKAIK